MESVLESYEEAPMEISGTDPEDPFSETYDEDILELEERDTSHETHTDTKTKGKVKEEKTPDSRSNQKCFDEAETYELILDLLKTKSVRNVETMDYPIS